MSDDKDDLMQRLRNPAWRLVEPGSVLGIDRDQAIKDMQEAADEIERLRKIVDERTQ